MKKILALVLCLCLILALAACAAKTPETPEQPEAPAEPAAVAGGTIYILGPTPDHGWTAQAGTYAEAKAAEITAEGTYKAVYMSASSGEEQVDQVNTIIANGDASGVVFFALDDSAKAGQEALIAEDVPFISFDRIIEGPDKSAILNASGDNWQCGAGIAYWLQKNGMTKGDTMVTLIGDNGTVCSRRQEGFEQFLMGETDYYDKAADETYHTTEVWTKEEIDALCADYKNVCNWSADGAYEYLEQKLGDIVASAKAGTGNLYIYSMDDEMTFGVMNLLEGNAIDDTVKADLEALNVYISAIGGMQELYDVMEGTAGQTAIAEQYFDDMMSVFFSPSMINDVIGEMLNYLSGDWTHAVGDGEYVPVWIVDKTNVTEYEGFTGHAA